MIVSISKLFTLLLGVALLLTGHGLQLALIPLRAEFMGWNSLSVGVLGSVYFGGFLAGCFSVPRLVARIGHIRSFSTLTAMMTSSILVLAVFESFWLWLLLRFLTGISISGLYLVIESWLNERTDNDARGSVLAMYTAIVLMALASGQLLLGVAPLESSNQFIIAATLIVLAAIPICVTRIEQPSHIPGATFSPLLIIRTSRVAALGATASGVVASVYYALGPAYGLQAGMEIGAISSMMALGIIGGALALLPLGRLSDRVDRRCVIAGAMLIGAVLALITRFVPLSAVPAMMFLFGACVMPIQALCLAHASDNIGNQSFLEVGTGLLVMHACGSIVGPLAAALVMQWFGSGTFFLFFAVILASVGVIVVLMIRTRHPTRDHFSRFRPVTTASAQGAFQMDPRMEEQAEKDQDMEAQDNKDQDKERAI